MKLRMLPVLAVLFILLLPIACSKPSYGQLIMWSCDEFKSQPHINQQTNVAAGKTITVFLCSDNTDYQWSKSAQISDQTVVKQTEADFTMLNNIGIIGQYPLAGTLVWTFKALKKGTSTITLEYSQLKEGSEKARWTYNLTVDVE